MKFQEFLIEVKINAALHIMRVEQRLNFYELIIDGEKEKAFEYMLQCVFDIAAAELKEQDIEAYNNLIGEE